MNKDTCENKGTQSISNTKIDQYNNNYSTQISNASFGQSYIKQYTHDSSESAISNSINRIIDDKSSICSLVKSNQPSKELFSSMMEPRRHFSAFQSDHQLISFKDKGKEVQIII